ncbi:conserved hypothetical protein [Desulforamulus reducens MI-1]|uniref:Ig-like domain-containing protein n=1 Tax=Desulforamulus reducens (strain ATCC BAA-1160 / DSM 100696 / MI-1) TaxID=349161 RepID=A4J348_DESRM|nr:hypothetical protein [Desulforamulus reducens]ABO49501.1 conserved hypothetical protein [Desulforamulus reducens MI-1]
MKNKTVLLFFLVFLLTLTPRAEALTLLNEGFNDLNMVDAGKTSALVDTTNHWVQLPSGSLTNAIAMLGEDVEGYAIAGSDGISVYERNDATGTIAKNPAFSCPWTTTATGVSVREDTLGIWAISPNSLAYYKASATGTSDDPNLKTSGLVDVLSVAAYRKSDKALVLQKTSDNKAQITLYEATSSLSQIKSFNPNILDPVSISMIDDSPDFRLNTKTTSYYFIYDDATGKYVEDTTKKISSLIDVISASSDQTGNAFLTRSSLDYYINDDVGDASKVNVLSPGGISNPVAAALRPGSFDQAMVDLNGQLYYWIYDDATGKMVRDSSMELSGIPINKGYSHLAEYWSKVITSATSYCSVLLTANSTMPPNTSIKWYISSNGGATFVEVTPGVSSSVTLGNKFIVKAILDTIDNNITPRILPTVKLEVNNPPGPPILPPYGACFTTSTPKITWTFNDPDPGDTQSSFQVEIARESDLSVFLDSGQLIGSQSEYKVPTSNIPNNPGPLWKSGEYRYKYRVKVWDQNGAESPWSNWGSFCVITLERPRIAQITSAPASQVKPDPANPTTHLMINQGMTKEQLPKVKAGSKVTLLVDAIGPFNSLSTLFPYGTGLNASVITNSLNPSGSKTNRYTIDFWTDPNLYKCPSGTLVTMLLGASSAVGNVQLNAPPYAEGVVVTQGSIYEDWLVVLQGRD